MVEFWRNVQQDRRVCTTYELPVTGPRGLPFGSEGRAVPILIEMKTKTDIFHLILQVFHINILHWE